MNFARRFRGWCLVTLLLTNAAPALAQAQAQAGAAQTVRVVGTVRDQTNAISLPGVPVEVVGTDQIVYTDVDGRYTLNLPPGTHSIKVALEGYQERTFSITTGAERTMTADFGLTMTKFAETVNVVGELVNLQTSSAEAQLIERKQSAVITDNVGAQEMKN